MAPPSHEHEGFEALLKPIQDITRNCNMNLCQYLEEYLSHIRIDVGRNLPSMNFAEAAYLLQNSANIYSKKVDMLWGIVIQLLEALRRTKNGERKDGERGGEEEEEDGGEVEGRGAGRKKRNGGQQNAIRTEDLEFIEAICSKQSLDVKNRSSLNSGKEDLPDPEKKKKIVLNAATKGKTKEGMSCRILDDGGDVIGRKEEFRLHWRVCEAGTLHEEFVNSHTTNHKRELPFSALDADYSGCDDAGGDMSFGDVQPADGVASQVTDGVVEDVVPPYLADGGGGDDLTGPGNKVSPLIDEIMGAGAQKMEKRCRDCIVTMADVKKRAWEPTVFEVNMPEKLVRKRKILRVPEQLNNESSSSSKSRKENRKRKKTEVKIGVTSYLTFDWLAEEFLKTANARLNGNRFHNEYELLSVFRAERQLRRQVMLRRRRAYQEMLIKEAAKKIEDDFEGFPDMDPEYDDEAGGFQGFIDDPDDNGFDDHFSVPLPDTAVTGADNRENGDGGTYESEALKTLQEYHRRDADPSEISSLADRVSVWHQLIRPKLEIAEKRSTFRIHEYGSRILEKFPLDEEDSIKEFGEIVAGLPREEVTRYFLATLCLTNTYNVELIKTGEHDMAMDCLRLRLLSRVRHHEEMHENMVQNATS